MMIAHNDMGLLNPRLCPHGGQGSAISQARRAISFVLGIAGQARNEGRKA